VSDICERSGSAGAGSHGQEDRQRRGYVQSNRDAGATTTPVPSAGNVDDAAASATANHRRVGR